MAITTAALLDTVKRNVTMPAYQARFSNSDLLKFADEHTRFAIMPRLTSIRQEFLVNSVEMPVNANQAKYKIHYRAAGRSLRHIQLLDQNGVFVRDISMLTPENRFEYSGTTSTGEPTAFFVESDYVYLVPTPPASNSYRLRQYFSVMPSRLVEASQAGLIDSVDLTTGVVTITTAVTGFTSGARMDFIDGQSGCTIKGIDVLNGSVSGTTLNFTPADLPEDLAVGDYVALAGETPVVNLPDELTDSLALSIVCGVLKAQGDFEGYKAETDNLKRVLDAAMMLLIPRVESKPTVVINYNGLLSGRRYWPRTVRFP